MKKSPEMTWGDLFAGGGGTTTGALMVKGVMVIWAVNHDKLSIQTHAANHPETKHFEEDIRLLNEKLLSKVNGVWASLECTEYSKAKGGKPKNPDSRTLAWELPRYVIHCDPNYVIVENVDEFLKWGPLDKDGNKIKRKIGEDYLQWVKAMCALGYNYDYRLLNAANYGAYTSRTRYFGIFAKKGYPIIFPGQTYEKDGLFGMPKWKPCKEKIDLEDEGKSIFGRKKSLVPNTLRRIAGGIRKFYPEMAFIMKYYGSCNNGSSINEPLHTIRTKDCHALVRRSQFLTDHCWADYCDKLDKPLRTQTTRQDKRLITVEKKQFLSKYYSNGVHASDINKPYPTITTVPHEILVTAEKNQFIAGQNNSNGKPEANCKKVNEPLTSMTTQQKHQFITVYFSSSDNPESQNRSLTRPLGSITTTNKNALATVEDLEFDFDIKMRFLNKEELAAITGFPEGYFSIGNQKQIVKMIGNAVPPLMAKALVGALNENFRKRAA